MANPSSIPAWKIPWTERPAELRSMGLQRVRHNWTTEHTHRILDMSIFKSLLSTWYQKFFTSLLSLHIPTFCYNTHISLSLHLFLCLSLLPLLYFSLPLKFNLFLKEKTFATSLLTLLIHAFRPPPPCPFWISQQFIQKYYIITSESCSITAQYIFLFCESHLVTV